MRPFPFTTGLFYLLYSLALDVFGVLMLVWPWDGKLQALRYPAKRTRDGSYGIVLARCILSGVTGFLVEGLRMAMGGSYWFDWSPGGAVIAALIRACVVDGAMLAAWHRAAWWFHVIVAFRVHCRRALHARFPRHHGAAHTSSLRRCGRKGRSATPFRLERLEGRYAAGQVAPQTVSDLTWEATAQHRCLYRCGCM